MSLHEKFAKAQVEIGAMPRTGKATIQTKKGDRYSYDYLTEDDLMAAVREHLSKQKVATYVSVTKQWEEAGATRVEIEVTFADGESGEMRVVKGQGAGTDTGDKGVYKAITGAVRYVLWKTMLVSTGDDHEAEQNVTTRAEHASKSPAKQRPVDSSPQRDALMDETTDLIRQYEEARGVAEAREAIQLHMETRMQKLTRAQMDEGELLQLSEWLKDALSSEAIPFG